MWLMPSLSIGGILGKPVTKYPYKGISDRKYIKEKRELFRENGNGWWWYQGTSFSRQYDKELENAKEERKARQKK